MSERRPWVAWRDGAAGPMLAALADDGPADWRDFANCATADPDLHFPEKGGSTREAKRVCMACDVRAECLVYALEHNERFGIWGGLSERQRRNLRRGGAPQVVAAADKKTCSKCHEAKPLSEFHQRHGHRTGRYESRCKACRQQERKQRWQQEKAA